MKILETIKLEDGQRIYVMGVVHPKTFNRYMGEYNSAAKINDWDHHQQGHYALRKIIRHHYPELSEWLKSNKCQTTNWVDPNISELHEPLLRFPAVNFPWGIGFKSGDPIETMFVLRWS